MLSPALSPQRTIEERGIAFDVYCLSTRIFRGILQYQLKRSRLMPMTHAHNNCRNLQFLQHF